MPFCAKCSCTPCACSSGSFSRFHSRYASQLVPSCWRSQGLRHWAQVTEPQSGHIKRFCLGRAKKPEEHCMHHLKLGSCNSVRSRSLRWNSSWTSLSKMLFRNISKLEKYSKCSSSCCSSLLSSGSLQYGQLQSFILRSVICMEEGKQGNNFYVDSGCIKRNKLLLLSARSN